jgi:quercetin dioxygenase-like cupin family protein
MGEVVSISEKAKFAEATASLASRLQSQGFAMSDVEQREYNPVTHGFSDGIYMRTVKLPADQVLVGKVHKKSHPFFLLKGTMQVLTEHGVEELTAPYSGITPAGTQRIVYTNTECEFVTVHATELTDPDAIEEELTAENFESPELAKLLEES